MGSHSDVRDVISVGEMRMKIHQELRPIADLSLPDRLRIALKAFHRHPGNPYKRQVYRDQLTALRSLDYRAISLRDEAGEPEALFGKCAVHAHAFYEDLLDDMLAWGELSKRTIHLRVTVSGSLAPERVAERVEKAGFASFDVHAVRNVGRDLGPLFTDASDLFRRFAYVAHIHTKRSPHLDFGDDWRRYLFANVIGSDATVARQIHHFEQHVACAVLYPKNFEPIRRGTLSPANVDYVATVLRRVDPSWSVARLDFPAGSMCWMRSAAFLPVLDRLPSIDEYEAERGQLDGTLAHALERCLTQIPHHLGFYSAAFEPER